MAIAENLQTLANIKNDIKGALSNKGVTVTDDFRTYADAVSSIPSGGDEDLVKSLIDHTTTSIDIPNGVTKISDYAFYNGYLKSVTIPDSVTSIGKSAFYNCSGLKSVTIPDSVTSIGDSAFQNCTGLTGVTIGDGVTSIGNNAFYSARNAVYNFGNTRNTVPSLSNTNAFMITSSSTLKIVVPDALYDNWIKATNWSNANIVARTVKYSEYYGS